ncbi:hypothetical protein [Opitutus terrae]|uniref:Secreted protein n=1 Tax=Opitutus terrae (strain DSM 11246 / JCM 15787 / PB90-1) TaxID=452637 RepID=B1ZSK0_OPITP|nr:hypothetical protein [Opitutus terrae]ACB73857.1 hypothetical protein Oter_0567 [Opitutus terrae PB90-1]
MMNFRAVAFAALALLAVSHSHAQSPSTAAQAERVGASFVLALGRAPTAAELQSWTQRNESSVSELLALHRQQLQSDDGAARAVAQRAAEDAFGQTATDTPAAAAPLYVEQLQRHVQRLATNPADYAQVIQRAYQRALRRDPYDVELGYWRERPVLSYALLVGCIENWGLRNAPGLMATTGAPTISVNSNFLTAVRLSPAIATEARLALGMLPPATGDQLAALADRLAATGRTLIAPGAGDVVSLGHIHAAVCGGPEIVLPADAR